MDEEKEMMKAYAEALAKAFEIEINADDSLIVLLGGVAVLAADEEDGEHFRLVAAVCKVTDEVRPKLPEIMRGMFLYGESGGAQFGIDEAEILTAYFRGRFDRFTPDEFVERVKSFALVVRHWRGKMTD